MSEPDAPMAHELFEGQLQLQSEAAVVIMDPKLYDVLKTVGIPNPVGALRPG